jgi:hypothetical protein
MRPNFIFLPIGVLMGLMLVFCLSLLAGAVIINPAPIDRLVHPGTPLETVMLSQRNDIGYLHQNPIDLTGLPGWQIFLASGFDNDGLKPHRSSEKVLVVQNRSESISNPIKEFLSRDGMPFADPSSQEL